MKQAQAPLDGAHLHLLSPSAEASPTPHSGWEGRLDLAKDLSPLSNQRAAGPLWACGAGQTWGRHCSLAHGTRCFSGLEVKRKPREVEQLPRCHTAQSKNGDRLLP